MAKNYYFILGISADASQEEIKSAYRQLVKELHPDHYGEDSGPFLEIQQAYSVLSDPEQRHAYDMQIRNHQQKTEIPSFRQRRSRPASFDSSLRPFESLISSFEEIFHRMHESFDESFRRAPEDLEKLTTVIALTEEQAWRGGQVGVVVPVQGECPACCGFGRTGFIACRRCYAQGVVYGEVPVSVPYPAGISTGQVIQVPLDRFGIVDYYLEAHFKIIP